MFWMTVLNLIIELKKFEVINSTILVLILTYALVLLLCLALIFLANNTVFSVFALILVFLISSLLLLLLDYEYLAIVLTAVYVGAISVFFVFVLMTINMRFEDTVEYEDEISKDKIFSFIVLFYFSTIFHVFFYQDSGRRGIYQSLIDYHALIKYFSLKNKELKNLYLLDQCNDSLVLSEIVSSQIASLYSSKICVLNMNYTEDIYEKYNVYNDVEKLALDLFNNGAMFFVVITFMLLLTMISSLGFAVRSR